MNIPTAKNRSQNPKYKELLDRVDYPFKSGLIENFWDPKKKSNTPLLSLLQYYGVLEITEQKTEQYSDILLALYGPGILLEHVELRSKILKVIPQGGARDIAAVMNILSGRDEGDAEFCQLPDSELLNEYRKFFVNGKSPKLTPETKTALKFWLEIDDEKSCVDEILTDPLSMKDVEDEGTDHIPQNWEKLTPYYPLYDYQSAMVKDAITQLSRGNVMLHMPTGAGKTRTAMNVISEFFRNSQRHDETIIWLASQEELCDQAAEEFTKAWAYLGNKEVDIIRGYGEYKHDNFPQPRRTTFAVFTLSTAHNYLQNDPILFQEFGTKCGLIVFDEAHQATADTYTEVLNHLRDFGERKRNILGLTATPGRLIEEKAVELVKLFDQNLISLKFPGGKPPIEYLRDEGYLARQETLRITFDDKPEKFAKISNVDKRIEKEDRDYTLKALQELGQKERRNIAIIDAIIEQADDAEFNSHIIVFACSIAHANLIYSVLKLLGYKAAAVNSNTPPNERRKIITDFKSKRLQIAVNYGVLATGFDAPSANVAVIARPTKSLVLYSQMVGRVIRGPKAAGGTEECRVLTVQDEKYGFNDLSESFNYWNENWEN